MEVIITLSYVAIMAVASVVMANVILVAMFRIKHFKGTRKPGMEK